ncbi:MAG: NAD kinase [Culicoidibacterales bacterium]
MKYSVFCRDDSLSKEAKQTVISRLNDAGFIYEDLVPNLVITIGGDGTLLEAFRQYRSQIEHVLFVGVHSGKLGFYTDWQLEELDDFLAAVIKGDFEEEAFPLLQTELTTEYETKVCLAMNEITVSDAHRTLVLNLYINGDLFETFRGTGFCASTPAGSTAYNKSLGGAVVHPEIKAFQLTEMASINNRIYRTIGAPLLFSENHCVKMEFVELENNVVFTNDHFTIEGEVFRTLELSVAAQKIRFARYRKHNFWKRVKNSFI